MVDRARPGIRGGMESPGGTSRCIQASGSRRLGRSRDGSRIGEGAGHDRPILVLADGIDFRRDDRLVAAQGGRRGPAPDAVALPPAQVRVRAADADLSPVPTSAVHHSPAYPRRHCGFDAEGRPAAEQSVRTVAGADQLSGIRRAYRDLGGGRAAGARFRKRQDF